jgi:NAD(P)-dependent dehydrogenase (short-subunit alcohol dehydrogenase family)
MKDAKNLSTAVIVTGGGSGIGRATSLALAESGRAVSIWDINAQGADATAKDCREQFGIKAEGRTVDLRDAGAMEKALELAIEAVGPVGGLAYVAGFNFPTSFEKVASDEDQWDSIQAVNLKGPAIMVRLMLPELRRSNPGSAVVFVASANAYMGHKSNPAYCASKAGLLGLAKSLAHGLGADGIRVNVVAPGSTSTPILEASLKELPGGREYLIGKAPLRRIADPMELAYPIRFLLSHEASFITGTSLVVDGGMISCMEGL